MASKKTTARRASKAQTLPDIYFRLNSLLHTVRCIAQHEDQLCTILHDIKQSNGINVDAASDLSSLIDQLPSHAYAEELEAVHSALDVIAMVDSPARPAKTAAKRRTPK